MFAAGLLGMTMRRAAGACILGLCLAIGLAPCQAGEPAVLRVALSEAGVPTSYLENGKPAGILKEMLEAIFVTVPGYRLEFRVMPWLRAQHMVEEGAMDMFFTFPSVNRGAYAAFTTQPVYFLDYGTLVYDRTGSNAAQIESARGFEDLKGLVLVHQEGVAWEEESVPAYIRRYQVNGPNPLMHMIFRRGRGDFFIMNPEKAVSYARQLGYEKQLGMRKVDFIPNSWVPFHIGLRRTYAGSSELLAAVEAVMRKPEFQRRKLAIERTYHDRYALRR